MAVFSLNKWLFAFMFDSLYLNVFNLYKPSLKQKANALAILYISLVQIGIYLLLMEFLMAFTKQMNLSGLSYGKFIFLIIAGCFVIYFRNWMVYTAKKRNVLKSKLKNQSGHSTIVLWLIPVVLLSFSVLFWIKLV